MRNVLCFLLVASLAACNSKDESAKESASKMDSSKSSPSYAYTASYSSDFEMGDPKNSATLMDLWKAWDDGDLLKASSLFADSVEMRFANGMSLKGPKDSVLAEGQKIRDMYTTVKSSVNAFLPARSKDKDQQWVCIWGTEVSTDKSGKTDSVYLQETWRLNKEGKADYLIQYAQATKPPAK